MNVSVTVPVYNTSKYIRRCLESLANQTLENIEFILVDDGSTDESGNICDEYAAKDSRFKVIHQTNGGLASARRTGLEAAKGDYVIVCDSDDWVEPNMYELLYHTAKTTQAEIVLCGYFAEYNDGTSIARQTIFEEADGIVNNFDLLSRGAGTSWVKLIKRTLFEETNSNYEPGISLSEDSLIVYKLLRGNPKVVQIKDNLYHYRRLLGGNSYTNNVKMHHISQLKFTYNWLKENYSGNQFEPIKFKRAVDLAFAYLRVSDIDKNSLNDFLKSELTFNRFVKNKKSFKSLFVQLSKIFPLAVTKYILKILYPYIYR